MEHMLSTSDNPYDPFMQFDQWYQFDTTSGYHCLPYLARVVIDSDELSELEEMAAIEAAIDEIVAEDQPGLYIKVSRETSEDELADSV